VVDEFIKTLEGCKIKENKIDKDESQKKSRLKKSESQLDKSLGGDRFFSIPVGHTVRLGEIVDMLYSFKAGREALNIPNMSDGFTKKLYATYLSYLPASQFAYPLKMNEDDRGSFTEFIRTKERGQVSVNISKPGITKGNHWHHTKNEKFLVVAGQGVIRFRGITGKETIEYYVDGKMLQVVDIPPGYTHNIENLGETDMVTIMWVNEPFDKEKADTYYLEV
jgi:UDP-2-acetamido-2,6-beta-L-arabino-hexul-4-ose reductase